MVGELNSISAGTHLVGNISSSSSLLINGRIEGNIRTSEKVTIGPSGSVTGNIICINADIEGRLEGELSVKDKLVLRATAFIIGDIFTSKLQIEQGASFNGMCKMAQDSNSNELSTDLKSNHHSAHN